MNKEHFELGEGSETFARFYRWTNSKGGFLGTSGTVLPQELMALGQTENLEERLKLMGKHLSPIATSAYFSPFESTWRDEDIEYGRRIVDDETTYLAVVDDEIWLKVVEHLSRDLMEFFSSYAVHFAAKPSDDPEVYEYDIYHVAEVSLKTKATLDELKHAYDDGDLFVAYFSH